MRHENYSELEAAVEETVTEMNSWEYADDDKWDVSVGTHHSGPALDVRKHGKVPDKVSGKIFDAALEHGWVVSGTNRFENDLPDPNHVRLFLSPMDEYTGGAGEDQARLEGFAAGFALASLAETTDDEPMDIEDAMEYVDEHNDLPGNSVKSTSNHDIHVYAPTTNAADVNIPDGWTASTARRYNGETLGVDIDRVEDDHIDAWDGFFEGDYDAF